MPALWLAVARRLRVSLLSELAVARARQPVLVR
jgi:hypothetical protein